MLLFSDVPFVEQFKVSRVLQDLVEMAWLENNIYIIQPGRRIRVFSDQAPFNELPGGIELNRMRHPFSIVSSATHRSLFISDTSDQCKCIWQITMPGKRVKRWDMDGAVPWQLSITPDDELLVVHARGRDDGEDDDEEEEEEDDDDEDDDGEDYFIHSLGVINLIDCSWTRMVPIPNTVRALFSAAKLPNQKLVISYGESRRDNKYKIGILSEDGESFTRTFDLEMFPSIQDKQWCPFQLQISDDGELFVADRDGGRVFLFNSRLTDYQIINNSYRQYKSITSILYIKNRRQILVWGAQLENVPLPGNVVSVYSLSPCSLIKPKHGNDVATGTIKRKRRFDATTQRSTGCKKSLKRRKEKMITE